MDIEEKQIAGQEIELLSNISKKLDTLIKLEMDLTNMFLKYDNSYNEEILKTHNVEG